MRHLVILTMAKYSTLRPVPSKVLQKGPLECLFDTPLRDDVEGGEYVAVETEEIEQREDPEKSMDEISSFRVHRLAVDDDNEPALESMPIPQDKFNKDMYWPCGSELSDMRKVSGIMNLKPTLVRPWLVHFVGYLSPLKNTVITVIHKALWDQLTTGEQFLDSFWGFWLYR